MKDKESSIKWTMDYCQHYTPDTIFGRGGIKPTGICAAGVKHSDVRVEGSMQPCIGGHTLKDPSAVCPKWLRKTREQGEKRYNEFESVMAKMRLVAPVVRAWRKKMPRGKQEVIECSACQGRLHLSQAASNGHVHGKCETKDCVSWME